jgi:hypothetical protein
MSIATHLFDLTARAPSTPAAMVWPSRPLMSRPGARALSVLFLAALVAALVIVADRFISTWADEHLFLGWVVLWVVVFGGMALFAGTARLLAARALGGLDGWSRAHARARAEARLWDMARSDPRVMADLVAIRAHTEADDDFSAALAPMGIERELPAPRVRGWLARLERLGSQRARNMHLYYV